jgi:hypothetical protein
MNSSRAVTSGVLGTLQTIVTADLGGAVPELSAIIPVEIDVAGLFTTNALTLVVAATVTCLIVDVTCGYLRKAEDADDALMKQLSQR